MKKRRGQTAMEYMALVAIVLGAFIAGGIYFKRGIQGRWKAAVDDLGDQYDPRVTNTDITYRLRSNVITKITDVDVPDGYWTMRDDTSNAVETTTGSSRVGAFDL